MKQMALHEKGVKFLLQIDTGKDKSTTKQQGSIQQRSARIEEVVKGEGDKV